MEKKDEEVQNDHDLVEGF